MFDRRKHRLAMGLCRECGTGRDANRTLCGECAAVNNAQIRSRRRLRPDVKRNPDVQRRYRVRVRESGRCIDCKSPSVRFIRCFYCRVKHYKLKRSGELRKRVIA